MLTVVNVPMLKQLITARIRRYCFHRCLSVNTAEAPLLVPGPFPASAPMSLLERYPSLWSQVPCQPLVPCLSRKVPVSLVPGPFSASGPNRIPLGWDCGTPARTGLQLPPFWDLGTPPLGLWYTPHLRLGYPHLGFPAGVLSCILLI